MLHSLPSLHFISTFQVGLINPSFCREITRSNDLMTLANECPPYEGDASSRFAAMFAPVLCLFHHSQWYLLLGRWHNWAISSSFFATADGGRSIRHQGFSSRPTFCLNNFIDLSAAAACTKTSERKRYSSWRPWAVFGQYPCRAFSSRHLNGIKDFPPNWRGHDGQVSLQCK